VEFFLSCTLQNSVEKKKLLPAFDPLKTALSAGEHRTRRLIRNNIKLHIKCYVAMTATSLCYSRTFFPSPAVESYSFT